MLEGWDISVVPAFPKGRDINALRGADKACNHEFLHMHANAETHRILKSAQETLRNNAAFAGNRMTLQAAQLLSTTSDTFREESGRIYGKHESYARYRQCRLGYMPGNEVMVPIAAVLVVRDGTICQVWQVSHATLDLIADTWSQVYDQVRTQYSPTKPYYANTAVLCYDREQWTKNAVATHVIGAAIDNKMAALFEPRKAEAQLKTYATQTERL